MYLRRKIDDYLAAWKSDPDRKPLIVRGCRQIGKTESVLHFAERNYESVVEINFVRDEKYKNKGNEFLKDMKKYSEFL